MDTVGRGDSATLGGMPLLEGGVVYHYRGLPRETHREPAGLQRLPAYVEADLDANQRPNSRRIMR